MLQALCSLLETLVLCTSFTDLSVQVVIKLQNDGAESTERSHFSFSSTLSPSSTLGGRSCPGSQ